MRRESVIPVPAVAELTTDTEAYCRAFNDYDNGEKAAFWSLAVAHINSHYRCPAMLNRFTRPRQFGGTWGATGVNLGDTVQCFEVSPWWLRNRPREHGSGVRCCYRADNTYIAAWPSRVTFTDMTEWQWARTDEGEAERTCCGAGDATTVASQACLAFRDRRPAPLPTNAPFTAPMLWTPRRRRAGGWGDPHCSTYDGFDFECNFHGEAVWSACGNWTVHAVAEPVGTGRATAITKFAVDANGTSVIGEITAAATDAGNFWRVLVDEQEVSEDFVSSAVTVSFSNQTVTVIDASGNEVEATFARALITLTTAPAEECRGSARGLCGNFNGDATDDLKPTATAAAVSINATSAVIYDSFVATQLVTDSARSLFPASMGVVTNTTYRPAFITADVLAGCPAACNGDRACCFDSAVGGSNFTEAFNTSQEVITRGNSQTVGLTENLPPVFESSPEVFEYNHTEATAPASAVAVTFGTFVATDSDNVAALTCSVCSTASVTCAKTGLGSVRATLTVTGPAPTASGSITCTATDSLGATAQAATTILAVGETSGLGFVTNPPTPAPKPVVVTPGNSSVPALEEQSATPPASDNQRTVLIVGVVVASVVLVAAIVAVIAFVVMRRKNGSGAASPLPKNVDDTLPPRAAAHGPQERSASIGSAVDPMPAEQEPAEQEPASSVPLSAV